jgi:AcrR family transcriptional regulator
MPKGSPPLPSPRLQKSIATRLKLLSSATAVIGEVGYEKASIARITLKAKVAHGTFYTYFKTRQDLFDRLLPEVGLDMLECIRLEIHGVKNFMEVEELGLRTMFSYLISNPGFYRLLNEAETLAPKAHKAHFKNLLQGYMHSLNMAQEHGELSDFCETELETLAFMLMGMRSYLLLGYFQASKKSKTIPDKVINTYLKFVKNALGSSRSMVR